MAFLSTIVSCLMFLQFHLAQAHEYSYSGTSTPIVPAVIVFGDSIVDSGNNNALPTAAKSNFLPYGRDFVSHQPTGRFSNGKISTDFLASKLGVKELMPAYLGTILEPKDLVTGVSFASAGTGYDPLTVALASVIAVPNQLELFKQYKNTLKNILGEDESARHLSESFFLVCAGSNDVVEYFSNPVQRRISGINFYADYLVHIASRFLQDLVSLGARKVGVVGIPPVGCMPSQRILAGGVFRECAADRNLLARAYNAKLSKEIQRLSSADLEGEQVFYIDIYSSLLNLIQHPSNFGFKVSELGCCGTGMLETAVLCNALTPTCRNASEYVFWDSYHPTQRASEVLVEQLVEKYINFIK